MEKIYVIQKRKLAIKEITVTEDTFIKVKDIGNYIFFDKSFAKDRLHEIIQTKNKRRNTNV